MNLLEHAKLEFRAAGWCDENGKFKEETQEWICQDLLKLLEVFGEQGHSGTSAPYLLSLFKTLASWEPIVPLTGEDWEWTDIGEYGDGPTFQNKRCSRVFKESDGSVYDIHGTVFWEWAERDLCPDEEGYPGKSEPYKSYYTCRESHVPVTFPYTPKTEYKWRHSDATPMTPPQTEEGLNRV